MRFECYARSKNRKISVTNFFNHRKKCDDKFYFSRQKNFVSKAFLGNRKMDIYFCPFFKSRINYGTFQSEKLDDPSLSCFGHLYFFLGRGGLALLFVGGGGRGLYFECGRFKDDFCFRVGVKYFVLSNYLHVQVVEGGFLEALGVELATAHVGAETGLVLATPVVAEGTLEVVVVFYMSQTNQKFLDFGELDFFEAVDELFVDGLDGFEHLGFLDAENLVLLRDFVQFFFAERKFVVALFGHDAEAEGEVVDDVDCNLDFVCLVVCIGDVHVNESVDDVNLKVVFEGDGRVVRDEDAVCVLLLDVSLELLDFGCGGRTVVVLAFEEDAWLGAVFAIDSQVTGGGVAADTHDFVGRHEGEKDVLEFDFSHIAFEVGAVLVLVEEVVHFIAERFLDVLLKEDVFLQLLKSLVGSLFAGLDGGKQGLLEVGEHVGEMVVDVVQECFQGGVVFVGLYCVHEVPGVLREEGERVLDTAFDLLVVVFLAFGQEVVEGQFDFGEKKVVVSLDGVP